MTWMPPSNEMRQQPVMSLYIVEMDGFKFSCFGRQISDSLKNIIISGPQEVGPTTWTVQIQSWYCFLCTVE